MKYFTLKNHKIERVYFKQERSIIDVIRDRYNLFCESSYNRPNEVYVGARAYHKLMEIVYDTYPIKYTHGYISDMNTLFGMKVKVSSLLMNNEVILLRTME